MDFEWDEEKAVANKTKHGVSFEIATQIFKRDTLALKAEWIQGEWRETDVGLTDNVVVLIVTHTDRRGILRVISARRATKEECRLFDDYYF